MQKKRMEVPIVSPEALEVKHFPGDFNHNAIWDVFAGPDGRIYISVCAEGSYSASAMLYAYDISRDRMEHLFDVEKVTHAPPRAIPQSKVHTSIAAMEDGRIIMCTHTTASAPGHPFWAPSQYYDDIWEGYPGSHIIVYDPKTNHAEDWGIPVPRETTYGGGCYVAEAREYYMQGMMRGHLYAFNVDTGRTRDLGRVGGGIRLFRDDKGRVYGISSGVMFRYDPFKDALQDLNLPIPQGRGVLGYVDHGPDGRYYISRLWSQVVFAFDPTEGSEGKIEVLGEPMPDVEKFRPEGETALTGTMVMGLRFAHDGLLYCGVAEGVLNGMVAFYRWDVLGGGKPELLGLLYAEGRPAYIISEMDLGHDGRLYIADGNYYRENPRLLIFDPSKASIPDAGRPRIPRPPVQKPLPSEQTAIELRQRSGVPDVRAAETLTIPLSRKVLPAGESDVVGMVVDNAGRVHIATTGKRGALAVWPGHKEDSVKVLHVEEEGFVAVATDGTTVFAATGPDKHCILAYDAKSAEDAELRVLAVLPDDCPAGALGCDTKARRLYGLSGAEHRLLTLDISGTNLKIGPATGSLMAGRRTVIAGGDGRLYGALDEGWIFRYDPESGELEQPAVRLPGLQGREFAGRWESAALAPDGSIFGGTSDGYLFRLDPHSATLRNLGKPALSLGMPALAFAADGALFGVAGTRDDLARLFRYTEAQGVQDLGLTVPVATCLVVMPDGGILVAGADRINDLALYRF